MEQSIAGQSTWYVVSTHLSFLLSEVAIEIIEGQSHWSSRPTPVILEIVPFLTVLYESPDNVNLQVLPFQL